MKCINCGNTIEDDVEFCYFCGCDPQVIDNSPKFDTEEESSICISNNEIDDSNDEYEQNEDEDSYSFDDFDYSLHGKKPLFEIKGAFGRQIVVYENKCVINTKVTAGSLLSRNATDGEKTIYYRDVIGVQFKKPSKALHNYGYLQLETTSALGNNSNNNFDAENTFTFYPKRLTETYEVYKYIIARLDEIKNQ